MQLRQQGEQRSSGISSRRKYGRSKHSAMPPRICPWMKRGVPVSLLIETTCSLSRSAPVCPGIGSRVYILFLSNRFRYSQHFSGWKSMVKDLFLSGHAASGADSDR